MTISFIYISLIDENKIKQTNKMFVFGMVLLVLAVVLGIYNLLLLYLFFVISLIPTFFIVLYLGNNW